MRVAILSYPMLFQRLGGLQVQVLETLAALDELGVDASLFDIYGEKLTDYDIVHVFGAINGNQRIVEAAKSAGLPIVLSPVLNPPWTRWHEIRADFCDRMIGRLTGWSVTTSHRQILAALRGADRVVALGEAERRIIIESYGIDTAAMAMVPNGISERFFGADAELFRRQYDIRRPFAICVASISPYKNQLGVIRALRDAPVDMVLIGGCGNEYKGYLQQCLALGGDKVNYVGALSYEDPMLASAYAAADILVLASSGEVAPISVLESLAAGTPVVITRNNSLDLPGDPDGAALVEVDPKSDTAIRDAVLGLLGNGRDRDRCMALVKGCTWQAAAEKIVEIYRQLLIR